MGMAIDGIVKSYNCKLSAAMIKGAEQPAMQAITTKVVAMIIAGSWSLLNFHFDLLY
jgi:hypothetical protein